MQGGVMTDGIETPDLPRQFAIERSNEDYKSAVEYGKMLFQILIGTNGLAATALVTLAGALKQPSLTRVLALPIFIYLIGVGCGTRGAIQLFRSKDRYGYSWQLKFFAGKVSDTEEYQRTKAAQYEKAAILW
jgi:hypothetical protein